MKPLELHERCYCTCRACQAPCRAMPGALGPGDADNIAVYLLEKKKPEGDMAELINEFIALHFVACTGETAFLADGTTLQIPHIVPKQREDGTCVFFDRDAERCTVHPVAPFGCTRSCHCGTAVSQEDAEEIAISINSAIAKDQEYRDLLMWLIQQKKYASPYEERKADMLSLVAEARELEQEQQE